MFGLSHSELENLVFIAFGVVFVPTWVVAMSYIFVLGRFFKELKQKEPDTWEQVGRPGLLDMLFVPFLRFHKYTSFLPHLIERKNNPALGYRWARPTYTLLLAGLIMFCLVLLVVIALAAVVGT